MSKPQKAETLPTNFYSCFLPAAEKLLRVPVRVYSECWLIVLPQTKINSRKTEFRKRHTRSSGKLNNLQICAGFWFRGEKHSGKCRKSFRQAETIKGKFKNAHNITLNIIDGMQPLHKPVSACWMRCSSSVVLCSV